MAWVKIPKEHHPLFLAAMPQDHDIDVLTMFGGIAAMVNGNMAGGLFGRSMMVKLDPADLQEALALDGASLFDPMGNGRISKDTAMLPDDVMEHPDQMRRWLEKAIAHARSLPPKPKKGSLPENLAKTARIPAFSITSLPRLRRRKAPAKRTTKVPLASLAPTRKKAKATRKKAKATRKKAKATRKKPAKTRPRR